MDTHHGARRIPREPSLGDAMIPLTFLVVSLGCAVYLYGDEAISGPVQVALFLSAAVAGQVDGTPGMGLFDKQPWKPPSIIRPAPFSTVSAIKSTGHFAC